MATAACGWLPVCKNHQKNQYWQDCKKWDWQNIEKNEGLGRGVPMPKK